MAEDGLIILFSFIACCIPIKRRECIGSISSGEEWSLYLLILIEKKFLEFLAFPNSPCYDPSEKCIFG